MAQGNAQGSHPTESETEQQRTKQESSTQTSTADVMEQRLKDARRQANETLHRLQGQVRQFDVNQAKSKLERWVEQNPTLAVFLAAGAGMLAGRVLSKIFHKSPPTLTERARQQALHLAHDAQNFARETGKEAGRRTASQRKAIERSARAMEHALEDRAKRWGDQTSRHAHELGDEVARRASDFGRMASDFSEKTSKEAERLGKEVTRQVEKSAGEASRQARDLGSRVSELSEDVSRRAKKAGKSASKQSARTADRLGKSAKQASESIRRRIKPRETLTEKMASMLKTVLVAAAATRIGRWLK